VKQAKKYLRLAFLVSTLAVQGCGSFRYRADANGFNNAYADSANHQLLTNLARLDQHDPIYVLTFGQISVQYNVTSSISGGVNNTVPNTRHVPIVTETGSLGLGGSTTPSWTFIPVTDDKVAQLLLLPMQAKVFYSLFQQGWPVDLLLRVMVQRLEVTLPGQNKTTSYQNDPGRCAPKSYAAFLQICAVARELQRDGNLKLRDVENFVPISVTTTAPNGADLVNAAEKNYVFRKSDDGLWQLGKNEPVSTFFLETGGEATFRRLARDPSFKDNLLENMRKLLYQGFSVQTEVVTEEDSSPRMILRSFVNALASAAQEQTNYDAAIVATGLSNAVREEERRPILTLRWDGEEKLLAPLAALDYHGQRYQITDPVSSQPDESASWNRDVFRLLVALASQTSIDTSKYPLPTNLQVLPSP
jgi:hypothetical protein